MNDLVYPIWLRSPSGGDNLYLASIFALNPDSGKLVWYYQTTPGEIWDFTCSANVVFEEMISNGEVLYGKYCVFCHGGFGAGRNSSYPDLAKMNSSAHDQFLNTVLKGSLSPYGMASFSDVLDEKEDAIHASLITKQQKLFSANPP